MLIIPISITSIENESDRSFMEKLFIDYNRLMYHTIDDIIHNPWVAEDLMQSTIVNLINAIEKLRTLNGRSLSGYIVAASKNAAFSYLRNLQSKSQFFVDDFDALSGASTKDNPEAVFLRSETLNELAIIWDQLGPNAQTILRGRFILNQSYAELSKTLNIKPESVRMAVTRAKREAKALLLQTNAL